MNLIIKKIIMEEEKDTKCKNCTNGCAACDARFLPEENN